MRHKDKKMKIINAYYTIESPCPQVYKNLQEQIGASPKRVKKVSAWRGLLNRLLGDTDNMEPPDMIFMFAS